MNIIKNAEGKRYVVSVEIITTKRISVDVFLGKNVRHTKVIL